MSRTNAIGGIAGRVKLAFEMYFVIVLAVSAASWCIYLRHPRLDTRPVFGKYDQFKDLTNYIGKTAHLYHNAAALGRGFPSFNYPPPAAYLWKFLLYCVPGHPIAPYMVLAVFLTAILLVVGLYASYGQPAVRSACRAAIILTAVIGYPLIFALDRANLEGLMWAITGLGLCFLLRGRYYAAAIFIGLSASIKPFAILFLLLLLVRRRYKETAAGIATTGLLVLTALIAIGPNPWKAYQALKPGLAYYNEHYTMALMWPDEARFGHSILDAMKSAALMVDLRGIRPNRSLYEVPRLLSQPGGWHVARELGRIYPYIALVVLAWILLRSYRLPLLNQMTALAIAAAILPPSSGDYTLLQLYVPFGGLAVFLAREVSEGKAFLSGRSIMALAAIYALLFAPLTFLRIYSGDAKLLLLIALLVVVVRSPMESVYFDSDRAGVSA